jgi:hypothetical protein
MAGRFQFAWRKDGAFPVPLAIEVLVGKSTVINAGDVLVLSTSSSLTTNGMRVVRPLFSGDTITTSDGLIGVAPFDVTTDANANVTVSSYPITVDNRGRITQQLPSIASALPTDPETGYTRLFIWAFDPTNVYRAQTAANDVADFYLLNRSVGITASAASAPSTYLIDDDAAAANAPLVVEGVDSDNAQFNSANGGGQVFVSCKSTFYARNTNGAFAA